ncbi:MAG: acyltransferase 3 [Actinomycetia bacterium]|nr:acyltransferase 3 [Actinomycetes bacterium]
MTTTAEERPAGLESAAGGNPRFPCIEGLRAVAAVAVLIHHVAGTTGAVTSTAWGWIFAHLDAGVSVFFVLSGFLLYRPFAAAHVDGRPGPGLRRYTSRRFLRIFPAYWLALTAVFFVLNTVEYGDGRSLAMYYGLVHIYSKAHVLGGIIPAWSLATELSFYVFLPVYALVLGRLARRAKAPLVVEAVGVGLLWVTGITVHSLLLATHDAATPATLWLPSQVDLFALGMLLAVAHVAAERGRPVRVLQAAGRWPGWTWALAGIPFWVACTQLHLPREFADIPKGGEIGRQVCYGLTALLLVTPAVFGDQSKGWPRRFLRLRPVAFLGLVSYGIFLWHFDLLHFFQQHGALDWVPQAPFFSALVLTLASATVIAWLSWVLVEAPLVGRRRRVVANPHLP